MINKPNIRADERLIVALDVDTENEAIGLMDLLDERVSFYKIGWQMFLGTGWPFVRQVLNRGKKVFLDLKINDIEETVRLALKNMPAEGGSLELLTIHGNGQTVKAAKAGRNGNAKPKILMLTALSSWDEYDLKDALATDDPNINLANYIGLKAKRALDAGCDGLIASGLSVKQLREEYHDREFLIVSPGIRPTGFPRDDHKRTLTPYEAITYGADYLVVGRPITRSSGPRGAAESVIAEIERASREMALTTSL